MREIKFRGYAPKGKEYGKGGWIYGYFSCHPTKIDSDERVPFITDEDTLNMYQVVPESVGQFTGLKDKNGKDVCEGDRLEHIHDKRLLVWEAQFQNGVFGIMNINDDRKGDFYPCDGSKYFFSDREVIGNVYEPSQKTEA